MCLGMRGVVSSVVVTVLELHHLISVILLLEPALAELALLVS